MTEIGAAEFKAHCLELLERVRRTREPLVVTKRGVPYAKLVPVDPPAAKPGSIMPNLGLNDHELDVLVAYLQSLQ